MVKFFLHIFDYMRSKRRLCMGMLAALTGVLIVMVTTLSYNENIFDFLPMTESQQKALTIYQDITGGQSVIAMVSRKDGDTEATSELGEAMDAFTQKVETGSGKQHISGITSQIGLEMVEGVTDCAYQNIPMLLSDSDYVRMEALLANPEFTESQLRSDIEMMQMPASGLFSSNISNDPLGFFEPVINRLQEKQMALDFELDDGHIFTPGRKYAIAMLASPYGAMESSNNASLVEYVDSMAQETMREFPEVNVELTGAPIIAVGNASQIKSDSQWAITIAVTLIIFLLTFSFRRKKNLMLIGCAITFGWLFALGLIAVMRSDVSLIVIGIGSIIIGIAVNYPLHFIAHSEHGGSVREVLKEMVSPLLIGNITTVGAFACLLPLDAPALRDLGLFAAFMLVGTILFVLVFLPHLVKQKETQGKEKLPFGKVSSISFENQRWLLVLILVITPILGYFSLGTSFDANMQHINYMTEDQQRLLDNLGASAGINDTTNIYIVTEADTWNEALEARAQLNPILKEQKSKQQINDFTDATELICDQKTQQTKIDRWNAFWQAHRDEVKQALSHAAPRLGFSDDAFDGFYAIIDASYTPQPFEAFAPLSAILLKNNFSTCTDKCVVVDKIDATNKDMKPVEEKLDKAVGDKGFTFDFVGMNSSVANSLSDDFNYIGFACGIIVFLFLWISFGRLELSILAFLPMAFGWLWILGIMDLLGMQFNIVNVILATFIFGQGDDYTIFITDGLINEFAYKKKLLPSYKNSIIISALIMFIGMGSLIISKHPALHSLAEVTIVGMLTVVFMAWIVPPLVFNWLTKSKGQARLTPVTVDKLLRTLWFNFLLLVDILVLTLLKLVPGRQMHARVTSSLMRLNIKSLWGVKLTVHTPNLYAQCKGREVTCSVQSDLDVIYLLALCPDSILVLEKKAVKHLLIRTVCLLSGNIQTVCAKSSQTANSQRPQTANPSIPQTANLLIHGTSLLMPMGDGFIARGRVDVALGEAITAKNKVENISAETKGKWMPEAGTTNAGCAEQFSHEMENSHFFHSYLIYKYMYKGIGYEKETRRLLRQHNDFSEWIDAFVPENAEQNQVAVLNAGRGQFALLFALVHPETQVHAYCTDEDDYALLAACEPLPTNLTLHLAQDEAAAAKTGQQTFVYDLSLLLDK